MAVKELIKIAQEMRSKWNLHKIAFAHRLGYDLSLSNCFPQILQCLYSHFDFETVVSKFVNPEHHSFNFM